MYHLINNIRIGNDDVYYDDNVRDDIDNNATSIYINNYTSPTKCIIS